MPPKHLGIIVCINTIIVNITHININHQKYRHYLSWQSKCLHLKKTSLYKHFRAYNNVLYVKMSMCSWTYSSPVQKWTLTNYETWRNSVCAWELIPHTLNMLIISVLPSHNSHNIHGTNLLLRATSHMRLRARDHYTSSTLIGGKGGAGVQVRFTLCLREQLSMWMQDGCNMDPYMASNELCFMVSWTIFTNHLLHVNLPQNQETMALRTLTTVDLFYFSMYEDPHEWTFIDMAFGWKHDRIWLHTTLEGPWPH